MSGCHTLLAIFMQSYKGESAWVSVGPRDEISLKFSSFWQNRTGDNKKGPNTLSNLE